MALAIDSLRRQTWALTKKNFTVAIKRSFGWTLFRAYILPLLIVALLLEIPNFNKRTNYNGVGTAATVKSLAESMDSSRKLAIVQLANQTSDVQQVIDTITEPLGEDKVIRLSSTDDVWDACNVDFHGNSNCHAVLTFSDSPGSGAVNDTWTYSIQVDPNRRSGGVIDVLRHNTIYENFWVPLQVAIDNAIANTTTMPEVYSFAMSDVNAAQKQTWLGYLDTVRGLLGFVFFLSMMTVMHHASTMMSSERESGLAQLVDAMGGGVAWPRVISYSLFFDLLYLPVWIIIGACT
jgi:ATP-binding cassette, subfamily A (ABC1), member 3